MYLKYILLLSCALTLSIKSSAQINVFEQMCKTYSPDDFENLPPVVESNCTELPDTKTSLRQYSFESSREIKAATFIEFSDAMELTPESGGALTAYIEELPFDVVAYVDDLNEVSKLSKFELGIKPPETVLNSIENFLNETGSQELNPYMSYDIDIKAVFKKIETDTVIQQNDPFPPEEVISIDSILKIRDGFFTKNVERDISGFDSLYTHPLIDNSNYVTGEDYSELGGGWEVSDSEYPFRVRFAPPEVGEWTCRIKIDIKEGQQVYISPTFTFNVVNSNKKGYLRVDNNKRFLKRDGESFRPIGVNYSWPSGHGFPLRGLNGEFNKNKLVNPPQYHGRLTPIAHYEQYLRMMDTLAMNGMNYFRMIMCPWSSDIEFEKLGDYTDRMHIAKELDLIVERAEQNDMLIHWDFMIHYHLQENPFHIRAWDWTDENGGDAYCYKNELNLNSPIEFFTNVNAKKYYKERLRYIISRWGYSPSIGMFEHFSEIDQVGTKHDENANAIDGTNQYKGNEEVINSWHGEMSWYLKEVLDIPQLLTLSYTTAVNEAIDESLDQSFYHGNIDVINVNQYNFFTDQVHGFHRTVIPSKIANSGDFDDGGVLWGNFNKPLFFSESGAAQLWRCDNFVETRRNIWQNMFWGIAGTLDWEHAKLRRENRNLDIYKRVDEFTQGVDLEGGNWHSGMVKLKNGGEWEYKKSFRDDAISENELVDVVYLRSGNKEKAFGVITNRRANYYTLGEGECVDNSLKPFQPANTLLRTYGPVSNSDPSSRIGLRNMKSLKQYRVKYYSPYDQVNPIKEDVVITAVLFPEIPLRYPDFDTLDVMLFEASLLGQNFKSMNTDTTIIKDPVQTLREQENAQKQEIDEVILYPNPNDGNFVVLVQNPDDVMAIRITDNVGKEVHFKNEAAYENQYNKELFSSGIYIVEVIFVDETIRKKVIIN